jgi:Spy/CpxP family protein refolding chaperone
MTRQVIVAVVVVATAGAVVAASLERPRPRRDRAAIRRELGLTADQESQLRRLRTEARKSGIQLQRRADLRHARLGLREALEAARVDEGAVQGRTQELADLRSAHLRARVEARLALRKILTPEQLEKLKTLRSERKPGSLTRPEER